MIIFKPKLIHFTVFFIAISLFFASVFNQIFFAEKPCQLCLISRHSYLAVAVFSIAAVRVSFLKSLLFLAVAFELLFGFYHLGVENHWWIGPQSCISELPTIENITTKNFMENSKTYCDKVNWRVFGISSTLWSFLISAFLFWIVSVSYILAFYLKRIEDE
jgi:disulfide bond formation protein DsbB